MPGESSKPTSPLSIFAVATGVTSAIWASFLVYFTHTLQVDKDLVVACVTATEKRNDALRERVDKFLLAQGRLQSVIVQSSPPKKDELSTALAEVRVAAFSLSAYADDALVGQSFALVRSFEDLVAATPGPANAAALSKVSDAAAKWQLVYRNSVRTQSDSGNRCMR